MSAAVDLFDPTVSLSDVRLILDREGFILIQDLAGPRAAREFVETLGNPVPQYTGALTHEVTHRPGNDGRAYSQSTNTILAHTEAPGWDPSPAYLALYCHRQARCGGGHTDLLDIRVVLDELDADEQALLTEREIAFPGPDGVSVVAMLASDEAGSTVVRFSYNLLTTGSYDPVLDNHRDDGALPLGPAGRKLAERVSSIFRQRCTSVLIPDGGLLVWDNRRMLHARSEFEDRARHLTRFWITDGRAA